MLVSWERALAVFALRATPADRLAYGLAAATAVIAAPGKEQGRQQEHQKSDALLHGLDSFSGDPPLN